MPELLQGLRVLILEDEFLIAMDIEQLCRDHGAIDVRIARTITEGDAEAVTGDIDAAIIDLMLGGNSTLDFASQMKERGVPFVFASGHSDIDAISLSFPGVMLVSKPYSGNDLVEALAAACGRR